MEFDAWYSYWLRRFLIGSIMPKRISIPNRFFLEMAKRNPTSEIPVKFLGIPFCIVNY